MKQFPGSSGQAKLAIFSFRAAGRLHLQILLKPTLRLEPEGFIYSDMLKQTDWPHDAS